MHHAAMPTFPKGPKTASAQFFKLNFGDPIANLEVAARQYGDPMTIPVFAQGPYVFTWDPEGIKAIFTEDPDTYQSTVNEAGSLFVGRSSLVMLDGADHKNARKMLAPPFHGDRMRAYGTLMRDATLREAERWEVGRRFTMVEAMQVVTLDVIIEAVFGVQGSARVQRLNKELVSTFKAFNPLLGMFKSLQRDFFGFGPWARFKRHHNALRAMIFEDLEQKRANPGEREDICSMLLQVRDEEGRGLSDQAMMDHLLSMVTAGHETTAASLAWALYLLHTNPAALARLREELAPLGRDIDPALAARLPYLEAVCQETMRLRPIAPIIMRKLRRPFRLKGYELPAGVFVAAIASLAHQREEVFPEPKLFRPERFLGKTFSPFEYMPFGGGARRCLGAAFAMYEMKIVLATLLQRYRLKLCEDKPVRHTLRSITFGPEGGVRMELEERL